jgi:hypothetical protein
VSKEEGKKGEACQIQFQIDLEMKPCEILSDQSRENSIAESKEKKQSVGATKTIIEHRCSHAEHWGTGAANERSICKTSAKRRRKLAT